MTAHFGDLDWIINQRAGFMSHTSLASCYYFMRKSTEKTQTNLTRRRIPITSGKIISDPNFGFWLAFFLPHHYSLVGGQPIYIFPNKPTTESRASLYSKLNDIRNFRNRVKHCEPLCFQGNAINCTEAIQVRTKLYNLVEWINPELVPFLKIVDNTQNKINQIMNI